MVADIIVLVIIAAFVFMGYRAGLFKTIISASSYILAIVLGCFIYGIVADVLNRTPLYSILFEVVEDCVSSDTETSMSVFAGYVSGNKILAKTITELIIRIISFIIVVIISKTLISLLTNILNLFARIPIIKQFNHAGGAIVGVLIGVVVVHIVLAVILACAPMMTDTFALEQIESSWLASLIYENNFLISLMG